MKKLLYIFTLCAFTMISCDKFVDDVPKGYLIPESVDDWGMFLETIGNFQAPAIAYAVSNSIIMSDNIQIPMFYQSGTDENDAKGYTWAEFQFPSNKVDNNWQELYGTVYAANIVLEKIDDAPEGQKYDRQVLKGSAYLHRAYALFSLVNLYAKHWDDATASTDLGVPIPLASDINIRYARSTVDEVYTQVLADIENGISLLPDVPESAQLSHWPCKAGAYGLLSRVYLYQANYALAKENAALALNLYSNIYDLNSEEYPEETRMSKETIWYKQSKGGTSTSKLFISDELSALFIPSDLRLNLFSADWLTGAQQESGNTFGMNGIAVPEVILNKVEANFRLGNESDAISDLENLMKNRFETIPDISDLSGDDLMNFIVEERRRELRLSGLRWFDLKRYNKETSLEKTLTHEYLGETYTLTPNSNRYVLAIPERVIALNPLIEQNPR